ncbi:aminotransferase-like domain-containing protein [Magnetospirillum molischianum]|uniref:Uncharacterized protein n=1 Tax=Magnetospirillum molischianum DSM 120 TaxID=1150626 RepID=H8FRI7_MAGML|nr:hypothetical protein [Magnetospirillum molischianum]CCG40975.1 hypothetical protein PHAMO_220093 [Magnetospirillum molischianum DSM 120]
MAAEQQTTLWPLAPLMVEIACRWLEDGTALRRVRWQREEIAARYRLARRALSGRPEGDPRPSPHAWLTLPTEDPDPAALCRRAGLEVVPAATFAVTREPPQRIRISLTAAAKPRRPEPSLGPPPPPRSDVVTVTARGTKEKIRALSTPARIQRLLDLLRWRDLRD